MKNKIIKFLKHFKNRDIYLYGEEYYIGERLLEVMKLIKDNDYKYAYNKFPGNNFEISSILLILDNLGFLEFGTSIRFGWIDDELMDEFDLLILLLEKDPQIIAFKIEHEQCREEYNYEDEKHISYIENLLLS